MAKILSIAIVCLVAMFLLLVESNAEIFLTPTEAPTPAPAPAPVPAPNGTTEGSLQPEECGPRCEERCSKTHHKKPCMFFCQKCCATCLCVPPGTYGNKEICPCYNNWKTKRGGPKCP
ncbi:protein RSI-1-like [Abrus precatorius]|uniref:Protein RSI-1-like n=1 Tax=Abrus precatorius TaxID=3816 RepID=A0A8B8MEG8_ABRPR|nr:protein RSI-1-like [Abrus precatorius]